MTNSQAKKRINLLVKIPQGDGEVKKEKLFEDFIVNVRKVAVHRMISFEILTYNKNIYFIINVNQGLKSLIEGQMYASFPDCEIILMKDYAFLKDDGSQFVAGTEMSLKRADLYPIKTYGEFEKDSLSAVFSVLARAEKDEQAWVQLVITPLEDSWWFHLKS